MGLRIERNDISKLNFYYFSLPIQKSQAFCMRRSPRCTHIFFYGFSVAEVLFPSLPSPSQYAANYFFSRVRIRRGLCVWFTYLKLETPSIVFDVTFSNRRLTYDPEWFECGGSETAFGWEQNTRSQIRRRCWWVGRIKLDGRRVIGGYFGESISFKRFPATGHPTEPLRSSFRTPAGVYARTAVWTREKVL